MKRKCKNKNKKSREDREKAETILMDLDEVQNRFDKIGGVHRNYKPARSRSYSADVRFESGDKKSEIIIFLRKVSIEEQIPKGFRKKS